MVTLKNLSKRMVVINLPHEMACSEERCFCGRMKVGVTELNKDTGEREVRALNKRLPGSLTLCAAGTEGSEIAGLPDKIARLPDVKRAKADGELAWELEEAAPTPAAPTVPQTPKSKAASAAVKE